MMVVAMAMITTAMMTFIMIVKITIRLTNPLQLIFFSVIIFPQNC